MTEQNINSMSSVVENVVAPGVILANTAELRTSTSSEQTAQDINSISSVMEFLENVLPGAIPTDSSEMVDQTDTGCRTVLEKQRLDQEEHILE
jgi:hypothetical protein